MNKLAILLALAATSASAQTWDLSGTILSESGPTQPWGAVGAAFDIKYDSPDGTFYNPALQYGLTPGSGPELDSITFDIAGQAQMLFVSPNALGTPPSFGNIVLTGIHSAQVNPVQPVRAPLTAPEIDPSAFFASMMLLFGGLAVIKGRRV